MVIPAAFFLHYCTLLSTLWIAPFCSPPSGLTGPSDITFLRASWLWSWLPLAGGGRLSDWVLWMGKTPAMLCLCCFLAWLDWPLLCAAVVVWVKWKLRVCILRWNQLECHSCKHKWCFVLLKLSCVFKCRNDITCTALKGLKLAVSLEMMILGDGENIDLSPLFGWCLLEVTVPRHFQSLCTY